VVADVLIKLEKFIFPVDFIVLETQPITSLKAQISVILSRPFLSTSNAVINYRNRLMKLSFGNITIDLSVFNLWKQFIDPSHEPIEVNVIQKLFEKYLIDEPLEFRSGCFDQ